VRLEHGEVKSFVPTRIIVVIQKIALKTKTPALVMHLAILVDIL
jgi:hypothetical protein